MHDVVEYFSTTEADCEPRSAVASLGIRNDVNILPDICVLIIVNALPHICVLIMIGSSVL